MLLRVLSVFMLLSGLIACSDDKAQSFNEFYQQVQTCQSSKDKNCQTRLTAWQEVEPIIDSLQQNPEIIGVDLMKLQTSMVLAKSANELEDKKHTEQLYYRVIRWFESPKG